MENIDNKPLQASAPPKRRSVRQASPCPERSLYGRLHRHLFSVDPPIHPIYYFESFLGPAYTKWLFKRRRGVHSAIFICGFYLLAIYAYTRLEPWTRFEVVYFLTVTSFTVGYGDLHPTSDSSRLLTMLVIIIGLAFVLAEVTELINRVLAYMEEKTGQILQSVDLDTMPGDVMEGIDVHVFTILKSIVAVVLYITVAAVFFLANEDDWSFAKALYFAVVTLTTVGYGDIDIHYNTTKVFLVFYIPVSVIVVGSAIGNIATARSEILAEKTKLLRLASSHEQEVQDMINRLDEDEEDEEEEDVQEQVGDGQSRGATLTAGLTPPAPMSVLVGEVSPSVVHPNSVEVNLLPRGRSASRQLHPHANLSPSTTASGAGPVTGGRVVIDRCEFLISMLSARGLVDRERDVEPLLERFAALDTNHSGSLTRAELMRFKEDESRRADRVKEAITRDLAVHRSRMPRLNRLLSTRMVLHDVDQEHVQAAAAAQMRSPNKGQRSFRMLDAMSLAAAASPVKDSAAP
jgi:potassium channel subfamily K, other eukaryote